jgi:hypothetical protein
MGFLLFILMLSTSEPTNCWYFLAAWLFFVLIHECREG